MRSKLLCILLLVGVTGFFVSCRTNPTRNQENKEKAAGAALDKAERKMGDIQESQSKKVAEASYAVDYALALETNATPPVKVARDINKRILSLTGLPNASRVAELEEMVVNLTSQLEKERARGETQLKVFDTSVTKLQKESESARIKYEQEIEKYRKIAEDTAVQADVTKAELAKYRSWWGLGGVLMGLKQFIVTSTVILCVMVGLYFLFRVLSVTNPIAASIFSIFDVIGSWFVSIIKLLAPKAIKIAGNVPDEEHDLCRDTLATIVDAVQHAKTVGQTLEDFIKELRLSREQTALVDQIKTELKWK